MKTKKKCSKVRYPTELSAMLALHKAANSNRGDQDIHEVRQYRCLVCRGWHLTSMWLNMGES